MNRPALICPTSALSLLLPSPCWAEQPPENTPLIEEIVVTGERPSATSYIQAGTFRGATQLDSPSTVAVIPRQTLDTQQAQNLGEAIRNTAGVTGLAVSPAVYTNFSIRGIPVDGRTNVKLNGSLSVVNFIDLPLENKSRVEVLKGVSALYYGFATPAGIINLVTRRPPAEPEVTLSASANGHGQFQGGFDGGAKMGILGIRGTLAAGSVDLGIQRTRGKRDFQSIAIQLEPSNSILFNLDFERIAKDVTEPTILQGPTSRALLLTELPRLPRARSNPGSIGFLNRAKEVNLLGRLRWNVARRWALTAEGGFSNARRDRRFSMLSRFDPTTGLGILTASAADDQLFRNRSFRADLTGNFSTGSLAHEVVLGTSNHRRRQYFTPPRLVVGLASPLAQAGCVELGLGSRCIQSAFDPAALYNVTFDGEVPYDPARDSIGTDTGFYAFDRIRFGGTSMDRFNVILGLRKAAYREYIAEESGRWRRTFGSSPLTLSGAVVVKPSRRASVYAGYIEGIESIPPAPNSTDNQGEILPPGKSHQVEIGIKVEPADGLLFNAAYFNIKRRLVYVNSSNRFVNDGTGHYRGFEAGLTGKVGRELSVITSAIYLDARQDVPGDTVIDGNRVENSAKFQWSAFVEYRPRKWLAGTSLNIGIFSTGPRAINPENSLFVEGYTVVDAGASYELKLRNIPITARATGTNIFGKRYVASTGSNLLAMGVPSALRFSLAAKIF